ncbi:MAG TPA: bifunctional metallophosphatase/5'-nucleotidase [Polyangia bacterium]|nr:bifunctional metallophosphatase/5'-nucleotidase [Polyangia bacterium]
MARTESAGHGSCSSRWFGSCLRLVTVGLLLGASACGVKKTAENAGTGGAGTGGAGVGGAGTGGGGGATAMGGASGTPQKLVILHTNDIHSHLMGFSPESDYSPATANDDATIGGMARLATAIGTEKAKAMAAGTPVLLLDGGDFMMGSLFELMAQTEVPELVFMQKLGYDATTIGNHELDWTPTGLAAILQAAAKKNITLPILASNMKFSATETGDDALKALADGGALRTKLVKTVGTLKVGFFGLLGSDAVTVTPQAAPLTFDPIATAAARMVTELRDVDKVDLVIALSHSGIDSSGKGEDATLAAAVPGIDIIISGHTHDKLAQPVKVGNTLIVTAGAYTSNLGVLDVTVTPGAASKVAMNSYMLKDIDDKLPGDATTQEGVDLYIAGLNVGVLAPQMLGYKKVVANTMVDLALPAYAEAPVGNLVTDAYRNIAAALQPTDPPALAVEANGQLRSPISKGKTGDVWFADLFRVLPIGIGPNQVPGFPLVTFYLNAKDLQSGLELGAAPELVPDQYFLQISGLKVEYDMSKGVFGRVSSLKLSKNGVDTPLDLADTTTCYKIVSTNYVAGLLGVVKSFTKGLLEVNAKDADCKTLIDPTTRFIDADPAKADVQELKHWQALLKYVSSFPDTSTPADGIPDMPAVYGAVQGRITKK